MDDGLKTEITQGPKYEHKYEAKLSQEQKIKQEIK